MFRQKCPKVMNGTGFIIGAKLSAVMGFIALVMYLGLGCEQKTDSCSLVVAGTVVDRETFLPIDSAWVSFNPGADTLPPEYRFNTDSTGYFHLKKWGCPRVVLVYVGKVGYETLEETVHTGGHDVSGVVIQLRKAAETTGGEQ